MLPPLVLVYVGEERHGLDVLGVLDRRLNRAVHVLTTAPERVEHVVSEDRVDAVVCCHTLDGHDLQEVVDAVSMCNGSLPIFDLSGDVAAVPDDVAVHHLYPGTDPVAAADELVGTILDVFVGVADEEHRLADPVPRGLGRYVAVDANWVVTDWDPRLEADTDVTPAEAVGTGLWELFPGWETSTLARSLEAVMDTRDPTTTDLYHEPTGQWLDVRIVPVDTGGIECFLRDITEYRELSDELEVTRERFENTLDRITDAFFALDNEERFVLLNSQAEFVLDVDADEVEGVRFWDAFPAAVSTTFYQEFKAAMEAQEPTSFEEYYRPLASWFEVNAYPAEDGLSVFLRDVTEQVELQNKLEQLHDVTRDLVVAESDGDIAAETVAAAEAVLDFSLVSVWRHSETTDSLEPLGWSVAVEDRVDNLDPLGPESEFIWTVFETREPRVLGFVPATTSTSHHPGPVTSELLVPIGEYGVMGAYADERDAFDETDVELFRILASTVESAFARARRERQLARQNERLHDFASIVSHDLRNPLNVASAHTELARNAEDPGEHLDKIEKSMYRMEDLIEDLLARAKGDQDLERETLSLADAARAAWDGVDTATATLTIDGEASLNADPDRIRQLFENLFRNAIDHVGDDVTVRVGPEEDGFFVEDDGPGIPEAEREAVFEQGVTHAEDGTGYGLAIVEDIVDGHGWSIVVTTGREGGARFEVSGIYSLTDAPEA